MEVTWTKTISFDFAEEDINRIVDELRKNPHVTDDDIDDAIREELAGYDDEIYYSVKPYIIIHKEIKKRLDGYQLSMFDMEVE